MKLRLTEISGLLTQFVLAEMLSVLRHARSTEPEKEWAATIYQRVSIGSSPTVFGISATGAAEPEKNAFISIAKDVPFSILLFDDQFLHHVDRPIFWLADLDQALVQVSDFSEYQDTFATAQGDLIGFVAKLRR